MVRFSDYLTVAKSEVRKLEVSELRFEIELGPAKV